MGKTEKRYNGRANKSKKRINRITGGNCIALGSTIKIGANTYEIIKNLQSGSTCGVYAVKYNQKYYALKVIPYALTPIAKNEIRMLKYLQPHCSEFILCVKDYGLHINGEKNNYIVTEYLKNDLFASMPRINVHVIDHLCKALFKLHQLGIAHRDIKLENIMLTETNQIKIIDFGNAVKVNEYDATNYKEAGTAVYIYPALSGNDHPSFELLQKSDVWSLGVSIFILLTKNYPYMICEKKGQINEEESDAEKLNQEIKKYMGIFMEFAKNPEESNELCMYKEFEPIMKQADAFFAEGQKQGLYTIHLRELLKGDPKNQKIYVPLPVTAETYTPTNL